MLLSEDSQLYRGIFWITDIDNPYNNQLYFQIPCNSDGIDDDFNGYTSKNNDSHNHKNLWTTLCSRLTNNKPYNYYPRGRVEIAHGKATVYLSPHINVADIQDWIIDKFNLNEHNGINKVKFIFQAAKPRSFSFVDVKIKPKPT